MSLFGIGDESFQVSPSGPSTGGAAALECTFLPDGAIVDCRGVTVTGILQWR